MVLKTSKPSREEIMKRVSSYLLIGLEPVSPFLKSIYKSQDENTWAICMISKTWPNYRWWFGFQERYAVPVAQITNAYVLDPVKDLVPLCCNCHSMAHRGRLELPPRSVEELKSLLSKQSLNSL